MSKLGQVLRLEASGGSDVGSGPAHAGNSQNVAFSGFPRRKNRLDGPRSAISRTLRPLTIGTVLIVAAYATFAITTTFWRSFQRSADHAAPVHQDTSRLTINAGESLAPHEVEIVLRDLDGAISRVAAGRAETELFIRQSIAHLEDERIAIYRSIDQEVTDLFQSVFSDREKAVNDYADWYFEWKRSYVVLKEAAASTANRAIELGRYEGLREAVHNDIRDYFLRHYRERILKPELRDPMIARGLELIARNAHQRYLHTLTITDVNARQFLREHGRTLPSRDQNTAISRVSLDWDAQKWKAPAYLMEDRAFAGITGLGTAGAGGVVGSAMLRALIDRTLARATASLIAKISSQTASRAVLAGEGAAVGTAIAPGAGTVAGAAIGVLAGFGVDYAVNETDEALNREAFVAANHAALQSTIDTWQATLINSMQNANNNWFNDAKAALVMASAHQNTRF